MSRLFFAGYIGTKGGGKRRKSLERVCKPLLGSKAMPSPPKQSMKFECQTWLEITKKFAKNIPDESSL